MSLKTPDFKYSAYKPISTDPKRSCANCSCYKSSDDKKGICYEYEVLPLGGCKFFKEKNNELF